MLKLFLLGTVVAASGLLGAPQAHAQSGYVGGGMSRMVICESRHGRYRECRTGFHSPVRFVSSMPNSAPCVEGRSWGQRRGVVWVRRSCRARFAAISSGPGPRDDGHYTRGQGENDRDNGPWTRDNNYSVTCSSNGHRSVCTWDNRYGAPRLIQQISTNACVEGRHWGYDSNGGLWVDAGCEGRFGFR
jgi:hypothetical protein